MEPFCIQTPEWYESLYSDKDYKTESDFLIRTFKKYYCGDPYVLDIGSGTGSLINYIQPNSSYYIALEPYEKFSNYLKNKFNKFKNFEVKKYTLQNYLNHIDPKINFLIANFNVLNYLTYESLLSTIKILSKSLNNKTILIFDTWSLDFVKLQDKKIKSHKLIKTESISKDLFKDFAVLRFADSEFNIYENFLDIEFNFISVNQNKMINIGSEKHRVFPFSIKTLIKDFESLNWSLLEINEYSTIINDSNFLSLKNQYQKKRNWYLSFVLQK